MNGPVQDDSAPPPREGLTCEVHPERDVVRVRPVGALDLATVPVLRAQVVELRDVGFRRIILDLGKLEFMDSTGLRFVLELDAEARQDGFSIAIVPGCPTVQRVFEVTRTVDLLPFISA